METHKRLQLTLFLENTVKNNPKIENDIVTIETIRQKYNPIQYGLIKAHVTLCREHELEDIEAVKLNLKNLPLANITIDFAKPIRFSEGKGVMIPSSGENLAFINLRKAVLKNIISNPIELEPHITLIHPRNATCTDLIFEEIKKIKFPPTLSFCKISLIEQINGGQWNILNEFELIPK